MITSFFFNRPNDELKLMSHSMLTFETNVARRIPKQHTEPHLVSCRFTFS